MDIVKRLYKKFIIMWFLVAMVFSLIACNNELANYKCAQKIEIQNYVDAKGKDNYSADNWIILSKFITAGNKGIDEAKDEVAVNVIVFETKLGIDGIEPKERDYEKRSIFYYGYKLGKIHS